MMAAKQLKMTTVLIIVANDVSAASITEELKEVFLTECWCNKRLTNLGTLVGEGLKK